MTITSVGYDGQVSEVQWAEMVSRVGSSDYGVADVGDWKASANTGSPYAVNIAPGVGWGHGVMDTSDAIETVTCPIITSGSRWDLIVAHRDWQGTAGHTTFAFVEGASAKQLPAYTKGPGVVDEQPIALVQWTAGSGQPTAIVDLRCWSGSGFIMAVDTLVLNYLNRLGSEVQIGQTNWRYIIGANSIAQWAQVGAKVITYGRVGPFTEPGNSGTLSSFNISQISIPDPGFPYQVVATAICEASGGGSGTRWDIAVNVSGYGAIANSRGDAVAPWFAPSGISSGAALTGSQTVSLVANKIFGSGNFGLSQFNQFFSVMVVPA